MMTNLPCSETTLGRMASTLLLMSLLTGCAYIPQKPLVGGETSAAPTPVAAASVNGAIFQSGQAMNYGYQPMFEDRRPRNVGDTLTIALQENVSASKSSSATASRDGSTDVGMSTVKQVLENGNLAVVGEKQIAINQGTEFIRFSGIVNPRTISASNTVVSTQVADARIEYVGNGYINEAQQMGWLQRLFLNLSPF